MNVKMTNGYFISGSGSNVLPAAILVTLVIVCALFRSVELGPQALWLDDAWVALISRHSWSEIWWTSLTSVGFRAIIGAVIFVFGDSTTIAQLFPFVAGLATIPATYLVARKLNTDRLSALFAASVVSASPLLVTYSTRVKQYTGDALLTLAIVASVIWLVENPRQPRRWWLLVLVCCLSIAFSGQLLLVVGPAVVASIVCSWESRREWMRIVFPALAVLGAFSASWYLAILKPLAVSDDLLQFWGNNFIVTDKGLITAATSFARGVYRLLKGAIGGTPFTLIGASVFFVSALVWRRIVALMLLLPVLAAIVAAAAGRAPIGVRTDGYLVPLIAIIMAVGFDSLFRSGLHGVPVRLQTYCKYAAIALGVSLLVIDLPSRIVPRPYQLQDVRSLTRIWEEMRDPTDRLFLFCQTRYAFALYSHEQFEVRPQPPGFGIEFRDSQITTLGCARRTEPESWFAQYLEEVHEVTINRPERIWLLASHTGPGGLPSVKEAISSLGYLEVRVWGVSAPQLIESGVPAEEAYFKIGDAELTLYTRSPPES